MLAYLRARFLGALSKPFCVSFTTGKVNKLGVGTHEKGSFPFARMVKAAALFLSISSDKRDYLDI